MDIVEQEEVFISVGKREKSIVEMLYATDVRIRELIFLLKEDFNRTEGIIHVRNGKDKKEIIVKLTQCALRNTEIIFPHIRYILNLPHI
ncbi:tyrosine-type recombinase/integrase [Virgibacillus halodenitrificans]|uniref:tyrosine-type recombinase/integrase n=1 Tax=Virgibacillus halodenitrificans TaxID=1482 RepID=UPI000EF50E80